MIHTEHVDLVMGNTVKLTNYTRDAFINSVLNDTPNAAVTLREQAHNLVREAAVEALPPKVRAVYDDSNLRDHLRTFFTSLTQFGLSLGTLTLYGSGGFKPGSALAKTLTQLGANADADRAKRDELRVKLKAVAYGCKTRKQLVQALPEFAKYLPAEDTPASRSLPVVANVVGDFVKAGWPKDAKK